MFFYYNLLPQGNGANNLVPILRVLSTYSARTLHMFWHVLIDVEACFGKSARYAIERCVRTSLALVHRHRRSFIVIGISFCAIFLPFKNLLRTWGTLSGEPYASHNILFVYCILLFYLRYLPQMNFYFDNVLQGDKQRSSWCSHWSQIFFVSSWEVSVAKVRHFEFAVINGNLRLWMRWV